MSELALLLGNGKILLVFWAIVGDDFHVTRSNFTEFPLDLEQLPEAIVASLLRVPSRLESAMGEAIQFKQNAGKRIGNYNLGKCREITDVSDRLFCEAIGIDDAWEDIELYYAQLVRTDFD